MKDYEISLDEFMANEGYSCKNFLEHMKYFVKQAKKLNIHYTLYRYKMIVENKYIAKVHDHKHSRRYVTLYDQQNKEVFTARNDITPKLLFQMLYHYVKQ